MTLTMMLSQVHLYQLLSFI